MDFQITTRTGDYHGDGATYLIWEVRDEDGVAGALYLFPEARMIANVEVREDRRGEGLARALVEAAEETGPVFHIPAWGCTEDGAAFAEAMGGEVMDDETAAALVGFDLTLLEQA